MALSSNKVYKKRKFIWMPLLTSGLTPNNAALRNSTKKILENCILMSKNEWQLNLASVYVRMSSSSCT